MQSLPRLVRPNVARRGINFALQKGAILHYSHSHLVIDLSGEHEGRHVDEHMYKWSSDGWRLVTVIRRQISGTHPPALALEYTFFWERG
jgi:hypothetical protein